MSSGDAFYTPDLVENLQYRYGAGLLSPGGREELALMFAGVPVAGRTVLDFGCGLGGYDVELVRTLGAAQVTGIDVDASLLDQAQARSEREGLAKACVFRHVAPGPVPFADSRFDIAFSKDAVVHLEDKVGVLRELARVTVPGGWVVLGDWFGSTAPTTPEIRAWAGEGDETFAMDSLAAVAGYAERAGLTDIETVDRNAWFCAFCRDELARLEGPLFETYRTRFGAAQAERSVANARTRLLLAEQGQLRPGHLRARKPG